MDMSSRNVLSAHADLPTTRCLSPVLETKRERHSDTATCSLRTEVSARPLSTCAAGDTHDPSRPGLSAGNRGKGMGNPFCRPALLPRHRQSFFESNGDLAPQIPRSLAVVLGALIVEPMPSAPGVVTSVPRNSLANTARTLRVRLVRRAIVAKLGRRRFCTATIRRIMRGVVASWGVATNFGVSGRLCSCSTATRRLAEFRQHVEGTDLSSCRNGSERPALEVRSKMYAPG
jgi:hypothetical protein